MLKDGVKENEATKQICSTLLQLKDLTGIKRSLYLLAIKNKRKHSEKIFRASLNLFAHSKCEQWNQTSFSNLPFAICYGSNSFDKDKKMIFKTVSICLLAFVV